MSKEMTLLDIAQSCTPQEMGYGRKSNHAFGDLLVDPSLQHSHDEHSVVNNDCANVLHTTHFFDSLQSPHRDHDPEGKVHESPRRILYWASQAWLTEAVGTVLNLAFDPAWTVSRLDHGS